MDSVIKEIGLTSKITELVKEEQLYSFDHVVGRFQLCIRKVNCKLMPEISNVYEMIIRETTKMGWGATL